MASSLSNLEMLFLTASGKTFVPAAFVKTKCGLFKKKKMAVSNWDNWLEPTIPLLFWFLLLEAFIPTQLFP